MATFASDITGPNQSVRFLDLDAGTTLPRAVPIVALLLTMAAVIFLIEIAGSSPAPVVGRLSVQRDALILPAVETVRRSAAPVDLPDDGVGPTVSMRDGVRPDARIVVTHTQPASTRELA
jgi:hypothetical protein